MTIAVSQPKTSCRVLIIEDEYFLADDLRVALTSLGAKVTALVGDLDEAIHQVNLGEFEVAVLDINLRGKRAFAVADHLLQTATPFVFVTGYDQDLIPVRFADVKRWVKPFEPLVVAIDVIEAVTQKSISDEGNPNDARASGVT